MKHTENSGWVTQSEYQPHLTDIPALQWPCYQTHPWDQFCSMIPLRYYRCCRTIWIIIIRTTICTEACLIFHLGTTFWTWFHLLFLLIFSLTTISHDLPIQNQSIQIGITLNRYSIIHNTWYGKSFLAASIGAFYWNAFIKSSASMASFAICQPPISS